MAPKGAPVSAKDDNEPSMEEILASIRKIIADDSLTMRKEPPKKPVPKEEPVPEPAAELLAAPVADEDADVLDLAEVATVTSRPEDVAVVAEEGSAIAETALEPVLARPIVEEEPAMALHAVETKPEPMNSVGDLENRILSENAGTLVAQAFQTLARNTPMPVPGRSLEDVVVELLRPMLRVWLDDNLPGIVEKLVRAEIERVARGV